MLKITEENVRNQSDVYEVCDISFPYVEKVARKENCSVQSPSAEDDNTSVVSLLVLLLNNLSK